MCIYSLPCVVKNTTLQEGPVIYVNSLEESNMYIRCTIGVHDSPLEEGTIAVYYL